MGFTVDIVGLADTLASIDQANDAVIAEVKKEIKTSGQAVVNGAKSRVPVNRGKLRDSIKLHLSNKGLTAVVAAGDTPDGYIGRFVEYGTGIYSTSPTAPKKPWSIRSKHIGGVLKITEETVVKEVNISGQKPQPFLFPAWEEERPNFIKRLSAAVKRATEKV